jgi:16S rRNA (guanine527-N7)-methyltransferase
VACPAWRVTLLEATGKKAAFLRHVCAALGVAERVTVATGRAEDVAHDPAHRARYDVATARAVASLPVLAEYLLPFCHAGGRIAVLKKGELAAEIAAAAPAVARLGGTSLLAIRVPDMADLGGDRVVLVSVKERPTPVRYPRRAGVPAREPLS